LVEWKYWLELGVGAALSGTVIGFVEGFVAGFQAPIEGVNVGALAAGVLVAYAAEKQTGDLKNILTGTAAAAIGIGVEGLISGFIPEPKPTV